MKKSVAKASSKTSWYIFFSIAFVLVIIMSLAASIRLTAMSQDMQSYAKFVAE